MKIFVGVTLIVLSKLELPLCLRCLLFHCFPLVTPVVHWFSNRPIAMYQYSQGNNWRRHNIVRIRMLCSLYADSFRSSTAG